MVIISDYRKKHIAQPAILALKWWEVAVAKVTYRIELYEEER